MLAKILLAIGILVYAVVVPMLEINTTHVSNPEWPPHARLHEVWQLASNSMLGALGVLATAAAAVIISGLCNECAGRAST